MAPFDVEVELGLPHHRTRPDRLQVVAIEGDVEGANGNRESVALLEERHQAGGELHAAALDPHNGQVIGAVGELQDLVGHAAEGAFHRLGVEHDSRLVRHVEEGIWRVARRAQSRRRP